MKIIIDQITIQPDESKVVYLHFLDDDGNIAETTSVAYTDDPDAFNATVQEKFAKAMQRELLIQGMKETVQSHIDRIDLSGVSINPDTKELIFKKGG